jgi:3-deoxy-D-manno-octulosonate 8-phosphate phosphatase (KDO 8-P phosphatase)
MQFAAPDALERARRVKLMLFDVDGVLTDGRLWYGAAGDEMKVFHAGDGLGVKLLAQGGVRLALLSGRSSAAVAVRARELGIEHVMQGIDDKRGAFEAFLKTQGLAAEAAGYMGDDLVDLPVLARCGFACTVSAAPEELRKRAHYVAAAPAGGGAAREVCEYVLRAQGSLGRLVGAYLE